MMIKSRRIVLPFDRPFCAGRFEGWLQLVMQLMGHNILRIKGIIHLKDHAGPMVIHGVQHIFHPPAWLAQWPEQDRQNEAGVYYL